MSLQTQVINKTSELGYRLNQAVHQDRRGEFGLLLSMLATEQAFLTPDQQAGINDEEQILRQKFNLPAKAPLQNNEEMVRAEVYGEIFTEQGLDQLRLMYALSPPPLRSPVRGVRHINSDVLANVDTINRNRHLSLCA